MRSPTVRNVVISLNGANTGKKLDKYIEIITPHQVCDYIQNRQSRLSNEDVKKFIGIVTRK
jgi:hypothetical protein